MESNLTLWLDASNSNYVKLDSSNKVEEWVDLSPKESLVDEPNTAARPSYDATNKAISFNGTSLRRWAREDTQTVIMVHKTQANGGYLLDFRNGVGAYILTGAMAMASHHNMKTFG